MKPTVAIGVPVYNGEKFLEECLESILRQTYNAWDCVIVNNQSTDNTASIAESFVRRDHRFRLVTNKEFVDITTNFNNAYKFSTPAKYFKVVCADDWIFPDYLDKMVELLEANPDAGLCSSYRMDHIRINCTGLNYYDGPVFNGREILKKQLAYELDDVLGSETTILARTDVLKKVKNYPDIYSNGSYHSDTSLAYELLFISNIAFVFQVLSYTRRSEGTYTSLYSNRFGTHLNLIERELFKYKNEMPELKIYYERARYNYGLFLLKKRVVADKKCIEWHKQRLDHDRRFSFGENLNILMKWGFSKFHRKRKKGL